MIFYQLWARAILTFMHPFEILWITGEKCMTLKSNQKELYGMFSLSSYHMFDKKDWWLRLWN